MRAILETGFGIGINHRDWNDARSMDIIDQTL